MIKQLNLQNPAGLENPPSQAHIRFGRRGVDASPASRFDHYQLLTREDGTPLELGHGAMGVTYKAIDINPRSAVALKVINARLIGDESARRRFVREARAGTSVRHPNVASIFHLGRSGDGYFYAMSL